MIMRRVIDHFRKQEWTAIFLDFVIVVAGVFLGLQVNNWNEALALRSEEKQQLAQLRDEIAANNEVLRQQSAFTDVIIAAGRRALEFLDSGAACQSGCHDLLIDFFHASHVWGNQFAFERLQEAGRLGFPSELGTRAAVKLYYDDLVGWGPVNLTPPAYRVSVRGYFSPDAAAALWDRCHLATGQLEVLSHDCVTDLSALDAAGMLEAIRADAEIANELRFWIGQNVFAQQSYAEVRASTAKAIEAITRQLDDAP